MTEKQITGGKYAGKVASLVYHRTGWPENEAQARLITEDGEAVDLNLPESVLDKIERGDNVYVTVEITRDGE